MIGQVLLGVVMVLGRNHWGYVFTSELPVISLAASTFPVVAMTCMGDGANAVLAGQRLSLGSCHRCHWM